MRSFAEFCISVVLLAVFQKGGEPVVSTTWFIDGNNLKAQRGVPSERHVLADHLKGMIATGSKDYKLNVVLVFDGRVGEEPNAHSDVNEHGNEFQTVVTGLPQSADDYIVDAVATQDGRAHVVTADKDLGRRVRETTNMKGGAIIEPLKFWRSYIRNLKRE